MIRVRIAKLICLLIADFKAFKDQFAYVDIAALNKSEYYAFLINVYNVFAIDMIITHACRSDIFGNCGALHSIEDIGSFSIFMLNY